jgi:dethiobiotin synthetase
MAMMNKTTAYCVRGSWEGIQIFVSMPYFVSFVPLRGSFPTSPSQADLKSQSQNNNSQYLPYNTSMKLEGLKLNIPGLFITATGTDVGKTVVTCALASVLRDQGMRVGVSKPMASGCRKDREGLVCPDTEALAHFADCRVPLDTITPLRYRLPLAPGVAGETEDVPFDGDVIVKSLHHIQDVSDCMLVEGAGGLYVPIDAAHPKHTMIDLMAAIGYPVLIVADAGLGTLNHTTMTIKCLKQAGCKVAGVVFNRHEPDASSRGKLEDPSMLSNARWLKRMTGIEVLAVIPRCDPDNVQPHEGILDQAIIDAMGLYYWPDRLGDAKLSD